jgi:hypothetical protein
MLDITFNLPSGAKVKAKLSKKEFQRVVEEAKLYYYEHTWKSKIKLFWTRKVRVCWIKIKEWFRRLKCLQSLAKFVEKLIGSQRRNGS